MGKGASPNPFQIRLRKVLGLPMLCQCWRPQLTSEQLYFSTCVYIEPSSLQTIYGPCFCRQLLQTTSSYCLQLVLAFVKKRLFSRQLGT